MYSTAFQMEFLALALDGKEWQSKRNKVVCQYQGRVSVEGLSTTMRPINWPFVLSSSRGLERKEGRLSASRLRGNARICR